VSRTKQEKGRGGMSPTEGATVAGNGKGVESGSCVRGAEGKSNGLTLWRGGRKGVKSLEESSFSPRWGEKEVSTGLVEPGLGGGKGGRGRSRKRTLKTLRECVVKGLRGFFAKWREGLRFSRAEKGKKGRWGAQIDF